MFLWIIPIPPSWAMQIAVRCSVTVSIAALSNGMLHPSVWVFLLFTETSEGNNLECPVRRSTSSNVRLSSIRSFSIMLVGDDLNNINAGKDNFAL